MCQVSYPLLKSKINEDQPTTIKDFKSRQDREDPLVGMVDGRRTHLLDRTHKSIV